MLDGVYTGKRVLIKGSTGSRCPAEDDVSVTIHDETLTFTDSILQKFIIGFSPDQSGSFSQMLCGLRKSGLFFGPGGTETAVGLEHLY